MQTVDSAKQFLLSRIVDQAAKDGIALSETEKRMFVFSEISPTPDLEANQRFEAECDDLEYERKIAKLLRHAYAHDKKSGVEEVWRENLKVLKKEDFYGLVMVDQAKIPRPKSYGSTLEPHFVVFTILELGIIGVAFGVLTNRIRSEFLASDIVRVAIIVLLLAAVWGLGKIYQRWTANRIAQRISHPDGT